MRTAICETYFPEGHKYLNERFLDLMSKSSDLVVVDNGSYFDLTDDREGKIIFTKSQSFSVKRVELLKNICYIMTLLLALFRLKKFNYDRLILLSCNNIATFFILPFIKGKELIVFHHYDIDKVSKSKIGMFFFNQYKNKIKHVVLAEFIKEGLINELGIHSELIFTVHQPLLKNRTIQNPEQNLIVGLGRNNDEDFLKELIKIDSGYTEELPVKIIMRSKLINYEGNNLKIINGYLTREEYEALINRAKAIIVTYPQTYRLRYSGVIDDTLSRHKSIISNRIPVTEYFHKTYPVNCTIIESPLELWNHIKDSNEFGSNAEFILFEERHSDLYIINQINTLFS